MMLRNIDSEKAGSNSRNLIYTAALTEKPLQLADRARLIARGAGFIYHCAEGQPGSIVAREFVDAANAGCLARTLIGIHCNAVSDGDWARWPTAAAGAVVWSPFSNLWLYGQTTNVNAARARGIAVCLGSDWGPSGTKHVLAELKVAKIASDHLHFGLTSRDLVGMITSVAGDVLARCWQRPIGRLVTGAFGDITVVRANGAGDVWSQVVNATERDIRLVVVNGKACYGDDGLMKAAGAAPAEELTVAGRTRRLGLWKKERARKPGARKSLAERYQDFLTAKIVKTRFGTFGHLRIWSFDVDDDEEFLDATVALLRKLPKRGLIIDLRDNPGGFIWAAERMLQLFTPRDVVPTRLALRATPLTAKMAAARFNQEELGPWAESLAQAPRTGEPYSVHLPITTFEQCNDRWQEYGGAVVTVVDANTYSSGDLFAAGVVDNGIGPVMCIGDATGAGGANVWSSAEVADAMRAADMRLAELAKGANFNVAVRRAVRSGDADGVLIEDSGIAGQPYAMTERDIFKKNRDLVEHCGEILSGQPWFVLDVKRLRTAIGVTTRGLDQLDVFADGHPIGPTVSIRQDGSRRIAVPQDGAVIEVIGFADGVVRQRRLLRS